MDNEVLVQALDFANYQTTLTQQKELIKQRFLDNCLTAINGGIFLITHEFLAGFTLLGQESQWILDHNKNPIWIDDVVSFVEQSKNVYQTALKEYGEQYSQLKKQRSVKALVGL